MKTDYQQQAIDFLNNTGVTFEAKFLKYDKHFPDDKDPRDIYQVTFDRDGRKWTFKFGQSLNASGRYWLYGNPKRGCSQGRFSTKDQKWQKPSDMGGFRAWALNPEFEIPCAYDVLATIQKYEVGTFKEFCAEFGYSDDSISALAVYTAVCAEYKSACTIWNEKEMELLREIN